VERSSSTEISRARISNDDIERLYNDLDAGVKPYFLSSHAEGVSAIFFFQVSGVWLKLILQVYRKAVCNIRYINDSHDGKKVYSTRSIR
jgi:hypothetical protein